MSAKHTSRHWTTKPAQGMGLHYHWIRGLTRKTVLVECTEQEARLIAAAPDLLGALQELLQTCIAMDLENQQDRPTEKVYQRAMQAARAAIAKASGVSTVERILENGEHIGWVLSDGTARYFSDPGDAEALRAAGGAA